MQEAAQEAFGQRTRDDQPARVRVLVEQLRDLLGLGCEHEARGQRNGSRRSSIALAVVGSRAAPSSRASRQPHELDGVPGL